MANQAELERNVALARRALRAPDAMRARIRAKLGTDGAPATALSDAALGSVAQAAEKERSASAGLDDSLHALGVRLLAEPLVPPLTEPIMRARLRFGVPTVALLVGIGFGAGYWLGTQRSEPLRGRTTTSESTARVAVPLSETAAVPANEAATGEIASLEAPTAETVASPPSKSASLNPPASPPRTRSARRAAAKGRSRSEELALLERSERAIRAGDSALALALLDELEQAFPASSLREERGAARVLAECERALGADGDANAAERARAGAARFLAERSVSVYSDRIQRLCRLAPARSKANGVSEE